VQLSIEGIQKDKRRKQETKRDKAIGGQKREAMKQPLSFSAILCSIPVIHSPLQLLISSFVLTVSVYY